MMPSERHEFLKLPNLFFTTVEDLLISSIHLRSIEQKLILRPY